MSNLIKAKSLLASGEYTCVLCNGNKLYTSTLRGVKPLVAWYEEKTDFIGFSAADKVVGRATAFLYLIHGVKEIYAGVISRAALQLLEDNGITAEYATLVDNIINRKGDGICPFEEAVLDITDPNEAYIAIRNKMQQMNIKL